MVRSVPCNWYTSLSDSCTLIAVVFFRLELYLYIYIYVYVCIYIPIFTHIYIHILCILIYIHIYKYIQLYLNSVNGTDKIAHKLNFSWTSKRLKVFLNFFQVSSIAINPKGFYSFNPKCFSSLIYTLSVLNIYRYTLLYICIYIYKCIKRVFNKLNNALNPKGF